MMSPETQRKIMNRREARQNGGPWADSDRILMLVFWVFLGCLVLIFMLRRCVG